MVLVLGLSLGYDTVQRDVVLGHDGRVTCRVRRGKVGDDTMVVTLPLSPGVL